MEGQRNWKIEGDLQLVVPQSTSTAIRPLTQLDGLRERILAGHRQTTILAVASAACALATGDALLQAKKTLGHGRFLPWIDEQLKPVSGLSRRTVQRYVRLAKNRDKLIRTIRKIRSDSNEGDLSEEDAHRVLAAMKMNDALNLLNLGGSTCKPTKEAERSLTPVPVVDAVADFLAEIDLDPCADEDVPSHVHAKQFYTSADNGLCTDNGWTGRAFVHPPQDTTLSEWVERSLCEFLNQSIAEAVLLLPANTAAPWMPLLDTYPRVYFWDPIQCDGVIGTQKRRAFPAAVFMLAKPERTPEFGHAFREFGKLFIPQTTEK